MATIKDIAKELGISPATVSRALNGFPEVRAETRKLVQETAATLGYKPNQIAQKLVSGRSGMVGMILSLGPAQTSAAGFYEIMAGLSDHLADRDVDLVFHAATATDPVAPYRRFVSKNTLDGFILNAPEENDPRIAFLEEQKIPFVVHGATSDASYAFFDIDNKSVAIDGTNLLADLGHRRIAFLNGPQNHAYAKARAEGYLEVMKQRGITPPEFALQYGSGDENYGYAASLALLTERSDPRPTAILCATTPIAVGVYRAAKDIGLSIPQDVSVLAHDDAIPQFRSINFNPTLSVTRAPFRDACGPLARILCDLLDGTPIKDLQIRQRAELIVRDSTKMLQESERIPWQPKH
ncbi:substrate-binding domain-containing protein [Pseudovibrio brasiliensis]|uniref:Substrate-binding domain-containing protein n=1 Tax=Pseudovibrio brasiliensis TaxID=1898042 RepID=A0ABX8AUE6_9HYPH|nr:substrate-binding domain-containing protein [Pseudovibrio brasiliensis]QUS58258.1 substrate-binding domain-containing protein [Pseudovibrio brasiliensis]